MDKYRELFVLSRDVLNEELERTRNLDEKASRYLSALTVLLGLYGLLISHTAGQIIFPRSFSDWAVAAGVFLPLCSIIGSWYVIFAVLRVACMRKTPLDIALFDDNRLLDVYYAMARTNSQAIDANTRTNDRKSKLLSSGYKWMRITVFLLIVGVTSTLLGQRQAVVDADTYDSQTGSPTVADEKSKEVPDKPTAPERPEPPQQRQDDTPDASVRPPEPREVNLGSDIPNPDVKPPEPRIVTEGCEKPTKKQ